MAVKNSLNTDLGNQTNNQILIGKGANAAVSSITAGTTGQILTGVTSGTPAFQTAGSTGQLLVGVASGQPTWVTAGTTGQMLTGVTSASPSFSNSLTGDFTFTNSATSGITRTLTVSNTSNTASSYAVINITTGGTTAANPEMQYTVSGAQSWATGIHNDTNRSYKISTGTDVASNNKLVLTTTGYMTLPGTCTYVQGVNPDQTNATGDSTIFTIAPFATSWFDRSSNFTAASGIFTAPVSGIYQFNATVTMTNLGSGHTNFNLYLGNTTRNYLLAQGNPFAMSTSGAFSVSGSINIFMGAGDTSSLLIQVIGSTKTVTIQNTSTHFGGSLVA